MMTLQEAKDMVSIFLNIPEPDRSKKIFRFQDFIWHYNPTKYEEDLWEILNDLAVALDDYEPNPEWRKDCPDHYYGEEKLIENIQETLQAIEALEIKNQNLHNTD